MGMGRQHLTQDEAFEQRKKYVDAFNKTMLDIWQEKAIMLEVFNTGMLLKSLKAAKPTADDDYRSAEFEFKFQTYGLFQNWGTGRGVYRGNPGDIGRPNLRKKRRWYDKKFFSSAMNIRDFFADTLGKEFVGMVSRAFSDSQLREDITL